MKKLLPYILILVVLVGLFSADTNVSAQDPTGTCYWGNPTQSATGYLQANCLAKGSGESPEWHNPTAPRGVCTINGTANSNWTQRACNQSRGTWKATIDPNYTLLSPLPCADNMPGCEKGQLLKFDPTGENKLGGYLNIMIRIFIGLCAVLAVIMIVIAGIEYMTSELVSSKEHGKERIRDALLGLLIALGAYALLNTINPDLLKSDIKIESAVVEVTLQEDREDHPPSLRAYTGTLPTGPAGVCSVGVVKSQTTGVVSCGSISANVDRMIAAAKQAGMTIWAGGFRTKEEQTALRRQNCGGDITNPNAKCTPATAVPGASRHESGLALDLACDGTTIQTKDNKCFVWLQAHAAEYGLRNLVIGSEPWHWSTDGR